MMTKRCRTNPAMTCIYGSCYFGGPCHIQQNAPPAPPPEQHPTDDEIAAWADNFIKQNAYNRAVAVQIAMEAAKWVRSRIAGVPLDRADTFCGDTPMTPEKT